MGWGESVLGLGRPAFSFKSKTPRDSSGPRLELDLLSSAVPGPGYSKHCKWKRSLGKPHAKEVIDFSSPLPHPILA